MKKYTSFLLFVCLLYGNIVFAQDDLYIVNKTPAILTGGQKRVKENSKARRDRLNNQRKQTIDSLKQANSNIIIKEIDKTLDIKDKIFIVNKSQSCINQLAIAIINAEGKYEPICSMIKDVRPGQTAEIISFTNNELKQLRGRIIVVKIKGSKYSGNKGDIIKEDIDENSSNITYDFDVKLYERRHDLYIEANCGTRKLSKQQHDIMDF